jgi:hypothetical protein
VILKNLQSSMSLSLYDDCAIYLVNTEIKSVALFTYLPSSEFNAADYMNPSHTKM